jgi:hypothetical protein
MHGITHIKIKKKKQFSYLLMNRGLLLEGCSKGSSDFEDCTVESLTITTSVLNNCMNAGRNEKLMKDTHLQGNQLYVRTSWWHQIHDITLIVSSCALDIF